MDKAKYVKGGFDAIARRYDLANRVLSLGFDSLWRKEAVRALGPRERVLDLCAGTLRLGEGYLKRFGGQVVALDFSLTMLREGLRRYSKDGLLPLCGDALRLPFPDETFPGAMVAFGLRNLTDPFLGLRELYRVLQPGGRLVVLEFGWPRLGLLGRLYRFYISYVVPSVGGFITGRRDIYHHLFRSIATFPSRQEVLGEMVRVGFEEVQARDLTWGICVLYEGEKR